MESKKHFDLLASFVLGLIGLYVVVAGFLIYRDAGEVFYVSPGLFPVVLGFLLVFCSILLLRSSLKDGGWAQRKVELGAWWNEKVRSRNMVVSLGGIGIMFVYTFQLMRLLPFWVASFVFLIALMFYLKSTSLIRLTLISALTIAAILFLFQVGFGVPLP